MPERGSARRGAAHQNGAPAVADIPVTLQVRWLQKPRPGLRQIPVPEAILAARQGRGHARPVHLLHRGRHIADRKPDAPVIRAVRLGGMKEPTMVERHLAGRELGRDGVFVVDLDGKTVIPGIIAAFWFSLATQVVVIEKVHGINALKRSRELMRGNIGNVFVLSLVIGIISIGPQIAAQLIPQIHARAAASVVINCIMTIFSSAAMVVFYFSCRCKNEQFDLQLLAENVGRADADDVPADGEDR